MANRDTILIDIDGTLADARNREHLITGEGWDAYYRDCINDVPILDVIAIVQAFHQAGFECVGITERPEHYWPATQAWLLKNKAPITTVLMRENMDFDINLKIRLAAKYCGGEENIVNRIVMLIDDQENVTTAFSSIGITTMLVKPRS